MTPEELFDGGNQPFQFRAVGTKPDHEHRIAG